MNDNYLLLVQAAQRGDTNAVEQLYSLTNKQAYLTTKSIVQNQNDAATIVKDSYLQAFYNINTIPNGTSFDKWFNSIVDKKSKEYLTKKNPMLFKQSFSASAPLWNDDKNTISAGIDQNTANNAMNVIYALPESQKLILIMFYNQSMNIDEIANTLELSTDEVKGTLYVATQTVQQGFATLGTNATPASLIFAAFNVSAQSCVAPANQSKEIVNALIGNTANKGVTAENVQNQATAPIPPIQNTPVNNGATSAVPQNNINATVPTTKKKISTGALIAIIGAAVAVVAIIVVILIFVFSSSDNSNGDIDATALTLPPISSDIEDETKAESSDVSSNISSNVIDSDVIFDESFALPSNYKVKGGSFDAKTGYDSGFGLDEVETIKALESLPEIKAITSDNSSYCRFRTSQAYDNDREVYNYYSGGDSTYAIFINTEGGISTNPTRLSLLFSTGGDDTLSDLRSTARSILESTSLDPVLINALLYSDMEDTDSFEGEGDTLGNYYLSNEIDENGLTIFITYYPSNDKGIENIKPKYYDDNFLKNVDTNSVFNNPDVDFCKSLVEQGMMDLKSISGTTKEDAIYNSSYYQYYYTTDQKGNVVEISYNDTETATFELKTDKISDVDTYIDYTATFGSSDNAEGSIELIYTYENLSDAAKKEAAKLAIEQFKFFDKDFSVKESDLVLTKETSKEIDIDTNFDGNAKGTLTIEVDESSNTIAYTLEWETN